MTATARQILRADADGTPEWLAQRTQGIGGTNAAELVLGLKSRFVLWREKTGLTEPERVSPELQAMFDYGHSREPEIRRMFTARTGQKVRNTGTWIRKDQPWAIANPDGFVGSDGILEIKTTGPFTDAAKQWKAGEVPDRAWVQAHWYAYVTGRTRLWFAAEVERQLTVLGPYDVDRDLMGRMVQIAREFWESVTAGAEPAPEPVDAALAYPESTEGQTVKVDPWDALADVFYELRRVRREIEIHQDRAKELTDELKLAMGDAEAIVGSDGLPLVTWKSASGRRTLDKNLMIEAGLNPDDYTKVGKPTRRFEVKEIQS